MKNLRLLAAAVVALFVGGLPIAAAGVEAPAAAAALTLRTPLDYQVFQRTDAVHGTITIAGEWSVPRGATVWPDALQARVLAPGTQPDPDWARLPFDRRARGFSADLPVAPGGWYRVQVRLLRAGDVLAQVEIDHVGVGEVFVIAGQSNSANHGEVRQQPQSGLVAAFDGERWQMANDPQPGATGTKGSFIPSFGDALARELHVPVGVVCVGAGGTSVREWMPAGHRMSAPPTTGGHCVVLADGSFVSSGILFDRLTERLRAFRPGGFRAVLWHQGESDWRQPEGNNIPPAEYRAELAELIELSRRAAGWPVPWFVAQVSYGGPGQTGSDELRSQQRAVVDGRLTFAGPNTDTLGAESRENHGRGVHFSAAGLKRHGELWAEIVGRWIERSRESASREASTRIAR